MDRSCPPDIALQEWPIDHPISPKTAARYVPTTAKGVRRFMKNTKLGFLRIEGRRFTTHRDIEMYHEANRSEPCPSTSAPSPRTSTSTSNSRVVAFTARREKQIGAVQRIKEAEKTARRTELDTGALKKSVTLDHAAGAYWGQVAQHKPSALTVEYQLENLIRLIGGQTKLEKIDDGVVADFVAHRCGEPNRKFKDAKAAPCVSVSSVNREVDLLKRWAPAHHADQ